MEIGFLKGKNLANLMRYSYILLFIAVALFSFLFFRGVFALLSFFVAVLFIYLYHGALLKLFCKIQENVFLDEYIGSLIHPVFGKVYEIFFRYILLVGSALLSVYLFATDIIHLAQSHSALLRLFILFILLFIISIFSMGLAKIQSKQNEYIYKATRKEFNLQTKLGLIIGGALLVFLSFLNISYSSLVLLQDLIALIFFAILFATWDMLFVRGAIEAKGYAIKYILVVLILGSFVFLFPGFPWNGVLVYLATYIIFIFVIAYAREYFQNISRRYRKY